MDFETWLQQLKAVGREKYGFTDDGIANTDWEAFRMYYDDGETPEEALRSDFSYA